jgi:hypothetical protein
VGYDVPANREGYLRKIVWVWGDNSRKAMRMACKEEGRRGYHARKRCCNHNATPAQGPGKCGHTPVAGHGPVQTVCEFAQGGGNILLSANWIAIRIQGKASLASAQESVPPGGLNQVRK